MSKYITKKNIKTFIAVIISANLMALALNTFITPNQMIPGGFAGISFLLSEAIYRLFSIRIASGILLTALNIPAALLAYRYISPRFTFFSLMHVFLLSIAISYMPAIFMVDEPLLGAIFGGLIYAFGNSLVLKSGASTGGTDFLALFYSTRKGEPPWNQVLYFNALLIVLSGFFYTFERAMYTIIFQYVNTRVIDQLHTQYKRMAIHIVTSKGEEVSQTLINKMRHGVTVLDGYGAYSSQSRQVLFTVVSEFEVDQMIHIVKAVDPKVFINISKSERIVGNFYYRPL